LRPLSSFLLAIISSGAVLAAGQAGIPPRPTPPPTSPQEPIATFRAGVRAIQLDAVVTDEDGNPVRGLTIDDFEITERGKRQPITTFEAVDIPIQTQLADLADADVVTNEADGRVYLVVIDSLRSDHAAYAKRELRRFFDGHFGRGDTAAIMFLDRAHSTAGQDFTSNRRLLIKGLDSIIGYSEESGYARENPDRLEKVADDVGGEKVIPGSASPFATQADERPEQADPLSQGPSRPTSGDPARDARAAALSALVASNSSSPSSVLARNRMERLKELAEFLIRIPGRRKAMLLVSEAIGFDASDFKDYAGTAMTPAAQAAHAALTAATRGNVAIYPVHPGGPNTEPLVSSPDPEVQPRVEKQRLALQAATLELRTLGAATGGFAHVNSNNFNDSFMRLVQEQSVYYMLAFNSGEDNDNGRYVPVKVSVKRPGMKVLAREGYVAPFKGKDTVTSPERRPGVQSALASPIPVSGVTLRAFAAPFKGKGKTASVLVALEMDPKGLGLAELPDGGLRGAVDVRMVATDARAKVLPQVRQVGNISIPPDARRDIERDGLHILTKTDLQPGRHQLRIAVGTTQRGGSVVYDLEIPDYGRKELMMSGIVLRGPNEPEGTFMPAGDPLQSLSIGAPTTARMFRSDEKVGVFAEIYDNTGGKPHTVDATVEIRGESGDVTPVVNASRSSDDLNRSAEILRLDVPLPLATLMPGRYVLLVDVKSSAGGSGVTRTVPFRVR
jgi:VWFA-related protein